METGWEREVYKSGSFVSRRTKVLGYKREPSRKPASNGHFGFSSFLALGQSSFLLRS